MTIQEAKGLLKQADEIEPVEQEAEMNGKRLCHRDIKISSLIQGAYDVMRSVDINGADIVFRDMILLLEDIIDNTLASASTAENGDIVLPVIRYADQRGRIWRKNNEQSIGNG